MRAQAIVCDERQRFALREVELPEPGAGQVAVKLAYSGLSIGTEFALVRGKISWGPYPICTGYMGAGVVEKVGPEVKGMSVGDRVYMRHNTGMRLAGKGTKKSAAAGDADGKISCVSGVHCSHVVSTVEGDHGVDLIPAGVGLDVASMFVMPAVGLYGVDMAAPKLGDKVVVYGVGQIGLGVVAACVHRGCRVLAVDLQARHLKLAQAFGAEAVIDASKENAQEALGKIFPGGADCLFECTGIPDCLNATLKWCRTGATYVFQGNYGAGMMPFEFLAAHGRKLRMVLPCDDGYRPCRRAVMRNIATGSLAWEKVITHRVAAKDAPKFFDRINRGKEKEVVGAVVAWK